MSATTQSLESDIAQMEDRLATVKVVVDVEREAWRRSSRTGKRGTKWKGAAAPRNKEHESRPQSTSNDAVDGITLMPGYWDALELAQYLKAKRLGNYAQVVVHEQITGKVLLDTPAPKLRKLFENVETSANDPSWKAFQTEYVKLRKHQRRLEKAVATNRSQPESARSLDSSLDTTDRRPLASAVMSSAGAALVFPLISPRVLGVPAAINSSQPQQNNTLKPPTASKPTFPLRKPASSNNIPLATCWNCKARFFRPHIKRPVGGVSVADSSQPVSSSMRASLIARAYCSKACQESIESSDMRISPSLSARVKVTSSSSNASVEEKTKRTRPSRVATGLASIASLGDQPDPDLLVQSDAITANRPGGGANANVANPPKARHQRKFKTSMRRSSRPDASLDNSNGFDFLHVGAPKRDISAVASSPRQEYAEASILAAMAYGSRVGTRSYDANASGNFSMCPSVTSLALNSFRTTVTPSDSMSLSPNAKTTPPTLMLSNAAPQWAPKQSKVFQQSKYKLDPDLFQAHQETFSSCFGAIPACNRPHAVATDGGRAVDYGRGNLLRLQEYLTVRALHRLSLTSRAWYELITMPSTFSDALWGVHVLRLWRPSDEDEEFLHDIGVLKKPERPRRMLQVLTRQVSRVMVENMKVLLNPESWQLATVMAPNEGDSIRSLRKVATRKRDRPAGGEFSEGQHRHPPTELYEEITVIYTRGGEIVAVCARQLIRPVDPMALLTDVLQGLKNGELARVHCRRLRLFSQTNRLPFDQWALLPYCSRTVIEFFWSATDTETAVLTPVALPVWHQKILSKLQHALQQRLLGKDSVNFVIKVAHDQSASATVLLLLEKFLTRCHTHAVTISSRSSYQNQKPESYVEQ
ncbi:hypothetical protein PRIC1_010543 [Phytophthora ramorum]